MRGHAAVALWLRRPRRVDDFLDDTVAMVGAREATDYGQRVA
ncbi:DNA-protecting protein DprA [Nocardia xishanensis]|nr:DNA-protecting protein DprA [Nocardia xishanensis]